MRNVLFLASVVLASACSNSAAEDRARAMAASMQALAPKELSHGLILSGAEADGATVVLRFSGVPEHYTRKNAEEIRSELKPVACNAEGYRRAIDGGTPLRFELSTTGGESLPSVSVSEC